MIVQLVTGDSASGTLSMIIGCALVVAFVLWAGDRLHPEMPTIHAGASDQVWFTASMLVSMIGVGLMCLPHAWPAVMSARDPKMLRRNYT